MYGKEWCRKVLSQHPFDFFNIGQVVIHSIPLKYPYVYYFLVSVYANPPLLGALSHTKTYLGVGERLLGGEEDSCIWH